MSWVYSSIDKEIDKLERSTVLSSISSFTFGSTLSPPTLSIAKYLRDDFKHISKTLRD